MNRLVMIAISKMLAKSILLATIITIVIGIIGYVKKWDTPLVYSNAFFIAGALVIIAGTSSRLAAGDDWKNSQLVSANGFRDMSSSERASFIVNASSSFGSVILGVLSGILLIVISSIVAKIP